MMLDRPQALALVAASKPGSKAPGNASVDDDDKARRFRDAALRHLDDVYTLARISPQRRRCGRPMQECYLRELYRGFNLIARPQ